MLHKKVYLASQSPRRQELLLKAKIPFELLKVDVEEVFPKDLDLQEVAEYLANLKADGALALIEDNGVVLTADTIVIQDNILYGKPEDREDAIAILGRLAGREHEVISGVCIASKEKRTSFSCKSIVRMAALSEEEIAYYVDTFQPYDKAGAYAIQEWIGVCKIESIRGSYVNIMGLPVHLVYEHLRNF